jgi:hypothetical protein
VLLDGLDEVGIRPSAGIAARIDAFVRLHERAGNCFVDIRVAGYRTAPLAGDIPTAGCAI